MSCDRNSNGVMTRSRTKDLEAHLKAQPEDSVSNVGFRASYASGISVAQIEYEEQLETHRILLDSQLEKLAREEAREQRNEAQAQAQKQREEARAELKT